MIIFLPISLNMCLGAQKNRLIEACLLSTLVEKVTIQYVLLSGGLL